MSSHTELLISSTFTPPHSSHAFPSSVHDNSIIAVISTFPSFSHICFKWANVACCLYSQNIYIIWSHLNITSHTSQCEPPFLPLELLQFAYIKFPCFCSYIPGFRVIHLKHKWKRHVYPNVHHSTVYNSQDMEAT